MRPLRWLRQPALHLGAFLLMSVLAGAAADAMAAAASYPSQPIRLVVVGEAGGGSDVLGRFIAGALSKRLGQPIEIQNTASGDGNEAALAVVRAKPDGYTLLLDFTFHILNPAIQASQPYDPIKDFTPITMLATNVTTLVVRNDHPAKSVADLIALARQKPGGLSTAVVNGSVTHMASELLIAQTGIDVKRVSSEGNPQSVKEILGGKVDYTFATVNVVLPAMKAGTLRVLGVTEPKRFEVLPDVPTIAETLTGYSVSGFYGLIGPRGLPPEVVATLNKAAREVLAEPEIRAWLVQRGSQIAPTTPQEYATFLATEIAKWQKVFKK